MEKEQDHPSEEAAWFDLNFVPQWARKPPGVNPYAGADAGPEPDRPPRRGKHSDRDRSAGRPRSGTGGPRRTGDRRGPEARAPRDDRPRPSSSRAFEKPVWLPIDLSFIPERAALRAVARRIQASQRAYPLLELAHFFLSNDAFHEVKIEVHREEARADGWTLARCRVCGLVSPSRDSMLAHAAAAHAEDVLEHEDVDEGTPSGTFICITRCRQGGHLVGPPNHHLYAERLAEIRAQHFAGWSEEPFQAQLETVRDPDLIEKWKESVRIRRVYRPKGNPSAEPMDGLAAQAWLEAALERDRIQTVRRAVLPGGLARALEDGALRRAVGEAWAREQRFPRTLLFALRPALRHQGLRFFRAGDHAWFVTAVAPAPVEPNHAVEPVRRILEHLAAHPGISIGVLLDALCPGTESDAPEREELLRHLKWLVEKGHVIEFSDGSLSVPRPSDRGPIRKDRG